MNTSVNSGSVRRAKKDRKKKKDVNLATVPGKLIDLPSTHMLKDDLLTKYSHLAEK